MPDNKNKKFNILLVRKVKVEDVHHINTEIQLVKSFNEHGHKAKLLGIGDRNKFEEELILLKFSMNKGRIFLLKLLFFLPFYCIKNKVNVLIIDNEIVPSTFLVLLIKKIFSIKIILDVRSIPVERELPDSYKHECRIAGKYFNGATFITPGTKTFIEQLIDKKFKHSEIFPSAVNPFLFSQEVSNGISPELKERIKNRLVLFYHGSISPNRGVDLILDALNNVKNVIPDVLFISLSGGNDYIREFCSSNNYDLEDNLLLLDLVEYNKVPSYINLADICIVPLPRILWWEISSPLKLMEYLSMEKPVILSDIEAHRSVVPKDSGYAYYFNPDVKGELEEIILKAARDLDKLKCNAVKAREMVKNKFTWDIQAKIIEDFIAEI